nr:MAG: putative E1A protein [unidentified adenovirus]
MYSLTHIKSHPVVMIKVSASPWCINTWLIFSPRHRARTYLHNTSLTVGMRTLVLNLDPSVLAIADELLNDFSISPLPDTEEDEGYVPSLYDLFDIDVLGDPVSESSVNMVFPETPELSVAEPEEVEDIDLSCLESMFDSDEEIGGFKFLCGL